MTPALTKIIDKVHQANLPQFAGATIDSASFRGLAPYWETLLHVVAARGDAQAAAVLLDEGAPIDLPDRHSCTALHRAVLSGHIGVIRLLLARGANSALQSEFGDFHALASTSASERVRRIFVRRKWIQSAGGPLIMVPESLRGSWGGASLETPMIGDDYERACSVEDPLGVITVGKGQALVLRDGRDETTAIETRIGPALLCWQFADSEAELLLSVDEAGATAPVVETLHHTFVETSQILGDSAWTGVDFEDPLIFQINPGPYKITTRAFSNERVSYILHVFEKC